MIPPFTGRDFFRLTPYQNRVSSVSLYAMWYLYRREVIQKPLHEWG